MSTLVVLTFDNEEDAGKLRETIRQQEKQDLISLDDSAVIVRDAEGKVHVKDQIDRGVKVGAAAGGLIGLLLGGLIFPIGGLVLGAAGGAAVGSAADLGIQKSFVKDVTEALQPGTSALFLVVRHAEREAALAALRKYRGEVYHTNLAPEDEELVRRALSGKTTM